MPYIHWNAVLQKDFRNEKSALGGNPESASRWRGNTAMTPLHFTVACVENTSGVLCFIFVWEIMLYLIMFVIYLGWFLVERL